MIQEILTYIIVIAAVFYLLKKFLFKSSEKGCDTDCNC